MDSDKLIDGWSWTSHYVARHDGLVTVVRMEAIHVFNGKSINATFTMDGGRIKKSGPNDIPKALLGKMRQQATAILREKRGVARGPHEKNGSLARVRQEDTSEGQIKAAREDGYKVD